MTGPVPHCLVTLLLRAPAGPTGAVDEAAVVRLLGTDGPPWTSTTATATGDRDVELVLALQEPDAATAARVAVDGVRARLGLDAAFARWVVHARAVQVRAVGGEASRA